MCRTWYDSRRRLVRDLDCGSWRIWLDVEIRRVDCPVCGMVKTETLAWLAKTGHQSERFVQRVGRRCREASLSSVAEEFGLHWETVKNLDIQYMQRQLADNPIEPPRAIGIDEISVRKGHEYRIVVHDLGRRRPIWFGGDDRSTQSMDRFYEGLGIEVCGEIEIGVMDMWKAFERSFQAHCPNGKIAYDHFHISQHLGRAIDAIRRAEYKRVDSDKRRFIKGQRYNLLSNRENLDREGRLELEQLLKANARLNKAYLLKESFDQLWTYRSATWAREVLRGMEAKPAMAKVETAGGLRSDDRSPLGWSRRHGGLRREDPDGLRRRHEQQDPHHPEESLRDPRRGVLEAQDPDDRPPCMVAVRQLPSRIRPHVSVKSHIFRMISPAAGARPAP
ncbi:MAG: ISL3 family transposase [Fibrobacteres bacterium]|nr:ISL3 family transposase [Fibrobacterota bacterium]